MCKAGSTKNQKDARQYIRPDLSDELRQHVATKAPQAPVFAMPSEYDLADMLRADLANARQTWLDAAKHDLDEYELRQQSDFLADVNHEGEHLDFHSLRHSTGAWLAMTGAHPKAVQSVMRHSSITLTMDTYGHLFPGQEADTVARFADLMETGPEALRATGTADGGVNAPQWPQQKRQQKRQQSVRDSVRPSATGRDANADQRHSDDDHKPLPSTNKRESVRRDASHAPKPPSGLEPETCGLQNRCSTN